MRNRAKCKLCNTIIESKGKNDYTQCQCGEIAIDGGRDCYRSHCKSWDNFLRIDDDGNEIPVQVQDKECNNSDCQSSNINYHKPTKKELIEMLDEMNKSFDNLPNHARFNFVTQCDLNAALLLIAQIFKGLPD